MAENYLDCFEFKGFEPNSDFVSRCQKIYDLVETRSPSESTKQACITKLRFGAYQAKIKITSASCVFEVCAKENKPERLMDQLYEKFSVEIVDWNKKRHF